jgi:hypothetical protein
VLQDFKNSFSFFYWRGYKFKGIQEMIDIEVFLSPNLESKEINSLFIILLIPTGSRILVLYMAATLTHDDFNMMLNPHFVDVISWTLAELTKAHNRCL